MKLKKILLILAIVFCLSYFFQDSFAGNINFPGSFTDPVKDVSVDSEAAQKAQGGNLVSGIENLGVNLLHNFKVVIEGLLLLFLVYTGVMMITSMGTSDEELANAKRSFRYIIVALLFINIPGTIYDTLVGDSMDVTQDIGTYAGKTFGFLNEQNFKDFIDYIIQFIQVFIFFISVLLLTLSSIKLIMSRGREEVMKEHKNNIFYSLLGLVFVWLIGTWKNLVFDGKELVEKSRDFFTVMANFVLLFAGPIGIFFLILAGYYFITSSGDEDRIKKAKHMVINVVLGTLILIASYTFLIDLSNFKL